MDLDSCPYCMDIDFKNQKSFCLDIKSNFDKRPLEMIWMHPNSMKRYRKLKYIKRIANTKIKGTKKKSVDLDKSKFGRMENAE